VLSTAFNAAISVQRLALFRWAGAQHLGGVGVPCNATAAGHLSRCSLATVWKVISALDYRTDSPLACCVCHAAGSDVACQQQHEAGSSHRSLLGGLAAAAVGCRSQCCCGVRAVLVAAMVSEKGLCLVRVATACTRCQRVDVMA
jgi:hypothetical protein